MSDACSQDFAAPDLHGSVMISRTCQVQSHSFSTMLGVNRFHNALAQILCILSVPLLKFLMELCHSSLPAHLFEMMTYQGFRFLLS